MAFAFLLPNQIEGDRRLIGDEHIIVCRITSPQSGQYGTCADFSSNGLVLEEFHSQLSAGKPVGSLQNSEFHSPHIIGRGTSLTDMQHRNDDFLQCCSSMHILHTGALHAQAHDGVRHLNAYAFIPNIVHSYLRGIECHERTTRSKIGSDGESSLSHPYRIALGLFAQPFRTVQISVLIEESVIRGDDHVMDVAAGKFFDYFTQFLERLLACVHCFRFRFLRITGGVDMVVIHIQHVAGFI